MAGNTTSKEKQFNQTQPLKGTHLPISSYSVNTTPMNRDNQPGKVQVYHSKHEHISKSSQPTPSNSGNHYSRRGTTGSSNRGSTDHGVVVNQNTQPYRYSNLLNLNSSGNQSSNLRSSGQYGQSSKGVSRESSQNRQKQPQQMSYNTT